MGYRLVLTYNLIHHESVQQLSLHDNASTNLLSFLDTWKALCEESYPSFEELKAPLEFGFQGRITLKSA